MKKYKLTDQNMRTHDGFKWEIGKEVIEEIEKFVKAFGNYYQDTKNTFEMCVDYFKDWIHNNLKY